MKFEYITDAVVPPMPPMPSDQISGLQVLSALRRNAYCAFPQRCLNEPDQHDECARVLVKVRDWHKTDETRAI